MSVAHPAFRLTVRAPFELMLKTIHICLILCILALLSPVVLAVEKAESLYDAKTAQKIDPSKLSILGPKAGKFRYDKRMSRAAEIASARARSRSTARCWRYVKDALLAADVIESRPVTAYAKQAAGELTKEHGFEKIRERNPYKAPLGSVLVYGGKGAGHVEIRTMRGFVSDFVSEEPSKRPLIGIYIKRRA